MKKRVLPILVTAAGLLLLAIGFCLLGLVKEPQGIMLALPYVCIGVGCGAFGQGLGDILSIRAMKNAPEAARIAEIEKSDERNLAISRRAKSRAFDIMIYVFSALILSYALMGVGVAAVLLLVFAYLFVLGCALYYRVKYEKEM